VRDGSEPILHMNTWFNSLIAERFKALVADQTFDDLYPLNLWRVRVCAKTNTPNGPVMHDVLMRMTANLLVGGLVAIDSCVWLSLIL